MIKIIPPIIWNLSPKISPNFLPISIPNKLNMKATIPIINEGNNGLVLINAKVKPTANASILVAIAKSVTSLKLNLSLISSSSSLKLSLIIFKPIIRSNVNPTIGAMNDMNDVMVLPQK